MNNTLVPDNIRLIASISRLIDLHQSRRETGVYIPSIPDGAGLMLSVGLCILENLRELELERGIGMVAIGELAAKVRLQISNAHIDDIQYCIDTLSSAREIQYITENEKESYDLTHTWDTTPLLKVAEGFGQLQLSDNARLLLRVSNLKESWLYSDMDAEKLVKAIERGQFKDVPRFCREMTLDLANKSKKLSGLLAQPSASTSELRDLLLSEGDSIAESLSIAAKTIQKAIALIYDDRTQYIFDSLPERDKPNFALVNLQADLAYVLSNIESVSRSFIKFLDKAQTVKNQGAERIKFLEIADHLILNPPDNAEVVFDSIVRSIFPWQAEINFYHPSMLIKEVSFKEDSQPGNVLTRFEVDIQKESSQPTFRQFIDRNKAIILDRLNQGPMLFSEALELTGYELEEHESPIDFFGVYATPSLLDDEDVKIIIGINNDITNINLGESVLICSDPVMFLEEKQ